MKRNITLMALLVGSFLLAVSASAQPVADRVPAGAIVYVGWQGTENVPGYAGSHFEAIIRESNIPAVFRQVLPQAIRRVAREDARAGADLQMVYDLLAPVAKYPTAFFFEGLNFEGRHPMPRLGLVCRAGADAEALRARLQAVMDRAGDPNLPVKVIVSGQDVALLVGYAPDEMALAGDAGGRPDALTADAGFQSALGKVKADAVIALHINVDSLFKTIDGAVELNANADERAMYEKVVEAIGLRGVKRLIATSGFDGKDWMERVYVEAPTPRKGILNMLDQPALGDDLLKVIPATADLFVAGSFDVGKLIAELRTIVGEIDPDAQKMFDQGLGGATMAIGRNLRTDVLDPLGAHWVAYSAPEVAGGGLPGMVVVNKPDDVAKAKSGLMAVSIFASNSAASALAMNNAPITLGGRQVKYGDLAINYLATPLVTPCWSVQGEYMIAGFYPQSVIGAWRQIESGQGLMIDTSEYKALRARLGAEQISGITFANLPATAPQGYQILLVLSRVVGIADLFGIQSPPIVIPPYHIFQENLTVAGGVSWVEDDGVHMKRVAPFPGAELLQGGGAGVIAPIIGMSALQTSIMLPSLNRARETANRVKCGNNLRQLGLAMKLFANENRGNFPADMRSLAQYAVANDVSASVFLCPSDGDDVPEGIDEWPLDQRLDWIVANTGYEYAAAGLTDLAGFDVVLIHEKLNAHDNDGINILYGDAHVEFHLRQSAVKELQKGKK